MTVPNQVGRYVITGELGRGAMGLVLSGVDPTLDRPVAVKVIALQEEGAPREELVARFLREAKLAARINHPGVVTIYDFGQDGDMLYLVMELVSGESLSQRIKRGAYPTRAEGLKLVAAVAEALSAAHALGVVHRDVKPANILLTPDGRVKVSDFGVAKAIGDSTELTRTGMTVGSPAYMAPEQVRGEPLDGRADLFSLGVIAYELLLHRKPFPADTVTTLVYQILNYDPFADPATMEALGKEVAAFLRRCLAKSSSTRIASATELAAEARRLAQLVPVAVEDTGATVRLEAVRGGSDRPERLPLLVGGAAAALLVLVLLLVFVMRPSTPSGVQDHGARSTQGVTRAGDLGAIAPPPLPPDAGAPNEVLPFGTAPPEETAPPAVIPTPRATPVPTRRPRPTAVPPTPTPEPTPEPPIVATYSCREGAAFDVSPEKAHVVIDGILIGIADDWDNKGGGQLYLIRTPGDHYVKFTMNGYETTWVKIVVSPIGRERFCDVDLSLKRIRTR
jgi:hypothetical protein